MRRLTLGFLLCVLALPVFGQSGVYISEYIEGSSNNKAIEIFNGTGAPLNVSNYQIRMFFNGNPVSSLNITLAGVVAPGDVYVLAQSSASPLILAQADQVQGSGWFNGDDAVALYHVPSASFIDVIGQIGFDPGSQWGAGLESTADNTLRRKFTVTMGDPNGADPFNPAIEWDGFATDDFTGLGFHGAAPPPPPPVTVLEIYEIQGNGSASPHANANVRTNDNIVTAVGPDGFFIQTPDYRADADAATSNGIYVFTSSVPTVAVGDQVDVEGKVIEFFNFTEFTNTGLVVSIDASGMPLPATFTLTPGYSNFEPLEGMLVRVTGGAACDGTDQFSETMIVAASTRPFRTPGIGGDFHPEILDVDPTELGGAPPSIVGGATIDLAEGPLAFDFGDYSIWTTSLSYTNPAYPRPVRARNAGEVTVGAQNMFRLFDTVNDPATSDAVLTPAVYATRLAKISDHVRNNLGAPDILAVSEVENMTALGDLAAKINFDQAGLNYVPYLLEGNDIGGIDVGFLVRDTVNVDSVEQLGATDMWNDPSDSEPVLLNDRPPLLLRGSYAGNGAPFPIYAVAVHQRSLIDVETSRVQQKRQLQAENLAGYLNDIQNDEPGARIVVTGDFNAFEFTDGYVDVMGILTSNANLTNQVFLSSAGERYSFVQEGVAQVLDHSLTSAPLNPNVRDLDFAHANADKPFETDPASDHDGVVLFVMTDHDADGYPDDEDDCPTGDAGATVVLDGCDSGAPNIAFPGGCTLTDQITALHAAANNHGQFVSSVGKLLNDLVKSGQLSGAQKGAIQSCAAQWN